MTEPKIRYDILANAEGQEDVAALTRELAKVDEALDPAAAAKARALADEIQALTAKRTAVDQFTTALSETNTASKNLEQAQEELARLERRLQSVQTPTRAQAGQLEKLRDAAARAQDTFTASTETLNRSRTSVEALGISTTNLAGVQDRLTASIRATGTQAQQLIARYRETAAAASSSAATQATAQRQVADSVGALGKQLRDLQTLAATAVGGTIFTQIAGDVARTADAYANLAARVRLVTGEGEAFDSAFEGVFDIATRTNSALESTGTLFTKIAAAGAPIGVLQRDALALTESINQAVQLSGSTAQASDAAIVQLIQGLQSGVLRVEEFNSVMEQAPRLAKALADGLGVTTGELRKLAEQGTLTSDVVIRALQGQAETLQREFESLPPTVGRAIQNLSTEWTRYVGQVDQANGISATASKAIGLLADNLGTLTGTLLAAGEAWLAFKALGLAATFAQQAAAVQVVAAANVRETATRVAATQATAAQTAALAGNTAATAANTAAKGTNAAANTAVATSAFATVEKAAGALGTVGRLTGALGLAGTAALLFGDVVLKAFETAGTAIGEGAAKLAGYRDRSAEVLELQKAQDQAAKAQAASQAALNQQLQQAEERALGLSVAAKKIVGEFEGLERKGESLGTVLDKLAKNLDLGDVQGIEAAGAALDALGLKGKLSGQQITDALAAALKGEDLAAFEVRARAAFDGSEQGVRRLQAALDALAVESLRRVGTSVEELRTGFSLASTSAINDVDALAASLQNLQAGAADSSRLLAVALNKATDAASTERAVQAVIDRLAALGEQGRVAGDDLTNALDKARRKLDELQPGVNTLNEALRTFGLKTREELQATADKLGAAYRLIAADVTVSLGDKARAFQQYSDAAIAATGGVETSQLRLERRLLEGQIAAKGLGVAISTAMGDAERATEGAATAQQQYLDLLAADTDRLVSGSGGAAITSSGLTGVRNPGSSAGPAAAGGGAVGFTAGYNVPVPEGYYYTLDPYAPGAIRAGTAPNGFAYPGYLAPIMGGPGGPAAAPAPAPGPSDAAGNSTSAGRTVTLNLSVGGRAFPVGADEATANALLAQIERERLATGG